MKYVPLETRPTVGIYGLHGKELLYFIQQMSGQRQIRNKRQHDIIAGQQVSGHHLFLFLSSVTAWDPESER